MSRRATEKGPGAPGEAEAAKRAGREVSIDWLELSVKDIDVDVVFGLLAEHLVYSQLRSSLSAADRRGEIEFFRTRNGVEVDFIVTLEGQETWAIEVKSGQVSEEDLKPLLLFRDYVPFGRRSSLRLAVVSLGDAQKRTRKGCLILGLNELLREMGL